VCHSDASPPTMTFRRSQRLHRFSRQSYSIIHRMFILGIIAVAASTLTGAGVAILAWIFVTSARDSGDRMTGFVMAALGIAHAATPLLTFALRTSHPGVARGIAIASLVLSALLVVAVPIAISAAARP
jgi:hypothetical protein